MRRKKLPLLESPKGKVWYGGGWKSVEWVSSYAIGKMKIFEQHGEYCLSVHYKKDPSYNWADEVRRKRRDTATRLQNRKRT